MFDKDRAATLTMPNTINITIGYLGLPGTDSTLTRITYIYLSIDLSKELPIMASMPINLSIYYINKF